MPRKVWDEITYPFLNFNGSTNKQSSCRCFEISWRPCDVALLNLFHPPIFLIQSIDHVSDFVCAVATRFGAVYKECFIHRHGIIIVHYFKISIRNHSACVFYVVLLFATTWCCMRTLSRRCRQGKIIYIYTYGPYKTNTKITKGNVYHMQGGIKPIECYRYHITPLCLLDQKVTKVYFTRIFQTCHYFVSVHFLHFKSNGTESE